MPKLKFSFSMFIFGTIGLFVRYIPLPTSVIALFRGIIGAVFLVLFTKGRLNKHAIKTQIKLLVLSGCFIGVEWVLFFEALRQTSVSIATLCYYMAPVFFLILSKLFFKAPINRQQYALVAVEIVGMFLVSGIFDSPLLSNQLLGIVLALLAAVFYACIVMCNQQLDSIEPIEKTVVQLVVASIVLIPYVLFSDSHHIPSLSWEAILLLVFVGVVHTGYAYMEYFGSVTKMASGSVAILSYIDPIVAIMLSAFVLNEKMTPLMWLGTGLILCVTLGVEMVQVKRRRS